jgi:hypothetical protein
VALPSCRNRAQLIGLEAVQQVVRRCGGHLDNGSESRCVGHRVECRINMGSRIGRGRSGTLARHNTSDVHRQVSCRSLPRPIRGCSHT